MRRFSNKRAVVLGGASLQGGEGTLYKSVIGVFIMIVLGNALNLLNVDSYWQRVAVGETPDRPFFRGSLDTPGDARIWATALVGSACAGVAQSAEQLFCKQQVAGSSPTAST